MPPKELDWKKEKYVIDHLSKDGTDKRKNINTNALQQLDVLAPGAAQAAKVKMAWVVSIGWLFQQAVLCLSNGQETMRFAVADETEPDENGVEKPVRHLYVEGPNNPGGWNNDWPEIKLP
jgi:hypothetical protein